MKQVRSVRRCYVVRDGRRRQVFRDRLGRFAVKPRTVR